VSGFSKRGYIVPSLAVIFALAPILLHAQDTIVKPQVELRRPPLVDLSNAVSFEVSPHTGLMGSSGTFGLNLMMTYSSFSLELAAEQVIGRTANLYPISLNVILNLSTRGRLIPYGTVGAGLMLTVPTNALGAETVSTLGLNFGGGARFFITRSFGIRVEGKQYITSVTSTRDIKDDLLFFQEVSLGVTFLFH
jgi:opacity protein-like surface antigen